MQLASMKAICNNHPVKIPHLCKVRTVSEYSPCLTETYLAFRRAPKEAWGRESSSANSSSLVTVLERVLSTARDPMGLKY